MDEKKNSLPDATVKLILLNDSSRRITKLTDRNGAFEFDRLSFGHYRIQVSFIGFQALLIDSIHVRPERYDFNLPDLTLKQNAGDQLEVVVIYAEKPLIQSKEGNITFNAGESPLSAGSNANELLKNVPLVSTDPDGKLLVRGKEPKILIDDKPVELNAQQLQNFLESLPGSMIERIEVMTNPPPQYANEQGGVINIITRKGKVGIGGRLNLSAGTRGESGINGNFNYRKKNLSVNFNVGMGFNRFIGEGYSKRQNVYNDSINYFNTTNTFDNRNQRPQGRLNIDYDINSHNVINLLVQVNQNMFENNGQNEYINLDRFRNISRLSQRYVKTKGQNVNPGFNFTYTHKGKKPGETLRMIAGYNYSYNQNDRYFFQEFMNLDRTLKGNDSTQEQLLDSWNNGYHLRLNYDKLLNNLKTSFTTGGSFNINNNHVLLHARYLQKPEGTFLKNELLSNDFIFRQSISSTRFSFKQIIKEGVSITAGMNVELTNFEFDLSNQNKVESNDYFNWLPFATFNKNWKEILHLTLSYRKSMQRPGIDQLNPSIDYSNPYNIRFGNPYLEPSTSHNFDVVLGRTRSKYYVNFGIGHNILTNVFSQIRTLQFDGKTEITWKNIDDRKEYEISSWSGITFTKKFKVNASASYSYNEYSFFDRTLYRYRNGGSLTSNLNLNFIPTDVWNVNGSFTYNRFANPQGSVNSNISMNIGLQKKFLKKKLIITLNAIDPVIQQQNKSFTYGSNFILESYNTTNTKNYRLTVGYSFNSTAKRKKR